MFMKLIFTLLAGLGLTVGGLSLHSSPNAQIHTHTASQGTAGTAASQSQSAVLAASGAGLSLHGTAAGMVVPAVVTAVAGSDVTIAPVAASAWNRAGLSGDATLTVPVTLSASVLGLSVQLSAIVAGSHVIAYVQQGVVTQIQLQPGGQSQSQVTPQGTQTQGPPTTGTGASTQVHGSANHKK